MRKLRQTESAFLHAPKQSWKAPKQGTQTDFYIREGAFCRIAFLHSVGCRSPPFLSASFDLMVIEQ